MIPDSVYGSRSPTSNGAAHPVLSSATPAVVAPERVDLLRVLTGLRHLAGSTEPGRVFAELAAVCVPALCDDVIVDIEEDGGHRYRIRRPGSSPATGVIAGAAARPAEAATEDLSAEPEGREVRLTARSVSVRVCSLPGGGPQYTTRLVCSWRTGYTPTEADAALVGVLADHATAVVHGERTASWLADTGAAHQVGAAALGDAQRVAAATGILRPCTTSIRRRPGSCWPGPVTAPTGRCSTSPTPSCTPAGCPRTRPSGPAPTGHRTLLSTREPRREAIHRRAAEGRPPEPLPVAYAQLFGRTTSCGLQPLRHETRMRCPISRVVRIKRWNGQATWRGHIHWRCSGSSGHSPSFHHRQS